MPELAAAGLWSTPNDLALLLKGTGGYKNRSEAILSSRVIEEMLAPQGGGAYGLGATVAGVGRGRVPQSKGYQSYLILFPALGKGMVVMTNSDNGSILADAPIRRAAQVYAWPRLGLLPD